MLLIWREAIDRRRRALEQKAAWEAAPENEDRAAAIREYGLIIADAERVMRAAEEHLSFSPPKPHSVH